METIRVGRRVLARAAAKLGGVEALAAHLEISQRVLQYYITGVEPVPDALCLRAIDVILEDVPAIVREPPGTNEGIAK